jgi:hypothetical protein
VAIFLDDPLVRGGCFDFAGVGLGAATTGGSTLYGATGSAATATGLPMKNSLIALNIHLSLMIWY